MPIFPASPGLMQPLRSPRERSEDDEEQPKGMGRKMTGQDICFDKVIQHQQERIEELEEERDNMSRGLDNAMREVEALEKECNDTYALIDRAIAWFGAGANPVVDDMIEMRKALERRDD